VYDDVNGGLKPFCSTEELVVVDYQTPDMGETNVTPTNVTFVTSLTTNVTIGGNDFKVVRGEHKVKLRGSSVEEEDDPPRRLGLFEIYGILLVSFQPMIIQVALVILFICDFAYSHWLN
jgi:hypothetical protein